MVLLIQSYLTVLQTRQNPHHDLNQSSKYGLNHPIVIEVTMACPMKLTLRALSYTSKEVYPLQKIVHSEIIAKILRMWEVLKQIENMKIDDCSSSHGLMAIHIKDWSKLKMYIIGVCPGKPLIAGKKKLTWGEKIKYQV